MDSRQHRRVRMRLPIRLRWSTPFGQKIELAKTLNVSRSGLLVITKESHTPGVLVWVTFPYDVSLSDGQPEILARVARCGEVLEAIRATNAREKVQTKSASQQERSAKLDQLARALGIDEGAPLLFIERLTYAEDGLPLDYEHLYVRTERFRYSVHLERHPPRDGNGLP